MGKLPKDKQVAKAKAGKKKYVKPMIESLDIDLNTPFLAASCTPVANCSPDCCRPIGCCGPGFCYPIVCAP